MDPTQKTGYFGHWWFVNIFCHYKRRLLYFYHYLEYRVLLSEVRKEKQLFISIAEGDEAAFRELFHLYMPQLYPMILKVTKVENVAEDIVQETFLKLWISRDKLAEIENPRAWILRIAYFQAFTFLNKKAIHQKAMGRLSERGRVELLRNDTEETMAFSSLQAIVRKAVYDLPGQPKKIYQLSREEGLKIPEIAKQLNLSEQTVKNTLGRALKLIREYVERAGHFLVLIATFLRMYYNQQ
ncbi:MAG TPA: RNA polymerase sigma-70 factor [Flavisolibacter sp.]|nr:RNA polymerase sigma-70 factor [Flavisolibacter sp.]